MVTINENKNTKIIKEGEETILVELSGLSTDEKPTNFTNGKTNYIANGSVFVEIDTGKTYLFDFENQKWYEKKIVGVEM